MRLNSGFVALALALATTTAWAAPLVALVEPGAVFDGKVSDAPAHLDTSSLAATGAAGLDSELDAPAPVPIITNDHAVTSNPIITSDDAIGSEGTQYAHLGKRYFCVKFWSFSCSS